MKPIRIMMLAGLATGAVAIAAGPEDDLKAGIDAYNVGDLIGAMAYFQAAADAGNAEAQYRLAYIQDYSENDAEALRLYQAAVDQGYAPAFYELARMYAVGEGTPIDQAKARELYETSARLGYSPGIVTLARYTATGEIGFEQDPERAADILLKAAGDGDEGAMRELAKAYREGGYGLAIDEQQARRWEAELNREESRDE